MQCKARFLSLSFSVCTSVSTVSYQVSIRESHIVRTTIFQNSSSIFLFLRSENETASIPALPLGDGLFSAGRWSRQLSDAVRALALRRRHLLRRKTRHSQVQRSRFPRSHEDVPEYGQTRPIRRGAKRKPVVREILSDRTYFSDFSIRRYSVLHARFQ